MCPHFIYPEFASELAQQASVAFAQGNYVAAAEQYEQAINNRPEDVRLRWYLGLALLLNGQEAEAQITWMTAVLEADEAQQAQWIADLSAIVQAEAERQEANANAEFAWLLRQHLREFVPDDLENLLKVLDLALKARVFSFEDQILAQVIAELQQGDGFSEAHRRLLLQISQSLLNHDSESAATLNFLAACAPHLSNSETWAPFINLLISVASTAYRSSMNLVAAQLANLCVQLVPDDAEVLLRVINFLQHGGNQYMLESIAVAERCTYLCNNPADRIIAFHSLLASWIRSGGHWQRATEIYAAYKTTIQAFLSDQSNSIYNQSESAIQPVPKLGSASKLLSTGALSFYFEDNPEEVRSIRNQLAQLAQLDLQDQFRAEAKGYQPHNRSIAQPTRSPKIGYLAGTLRQHSVGWLCRWLLKYHDRSRFDVRLYSTRQSNDFVQSDLINDYGDRFQIISSTIQDVANRIAQDEIDILIELDSLSSYDGCAVVALKPAPIQVHWLGYDSSGIPSVDYFIIDPYVLPNKAQAYYSERLWRLPHTFIAIDGFEVNPPSLRRDQLGIPTDAVVYLSSQSGMKRNVDHARLQLRILKEVPNSYFLIKCYLSNPEFVQEHFQQIAEEEGVSADRLRFLPDESSEFVHRANLGLADIILDTYPYSGATTTLEALWMGLPVVTRVGEQFAARNSYSMMMNVGTTEGIAWSDDEYIQWGIRLGTDQKLRESIFYRLRQSRHTSPLWNVQQFTREMEKAYEQMWEVYKSGNQ